MKPARLLIGWHTERLGLQLIAAGGPVDAGAVSANLRVARDAVAARPEYVGMTARPEGLPSELDGHLARFWANPAYQNFVTEGWSARMVDLRTVVAGQDRVWLDRIRVPRRPSTVTELADITLPAETIDHQVGVQAGATGIMLTSATPNLRVQGPFVGPVGSGGPTVAGFIVGVTQSVVQVAELNGRLILRDGYHRAFELLRHGVHEVPALVRPVATSEEVLVPAVGILPTGAWLGSRPPMLPDFLQEDVSLDVRLPRRAEKVITVQCAEYY